MAIGGTRPAVYGHAECWRVDDGRRRRPREPCPHHAFSQGLAGLGWKQGENVRVEYRWSAGNSELIRQYAKELVTLAPDVILANGTPAVVELKKITSSIPIVCALVQDPVGLGLVKSLSHPGGN